MYGFHTLRRSVPPCGPTISSWYSSSPPHSLSPPITSLSLFSRLLLDSSVPSHSLLGPVSPPLLSSFPLPCLPTSSRSLLIRSQSLSLPLSISHYLSLSSLSLSLNLSPSHLNSSIPFPSYFFPHLSLSLHPCISLLLSSPIPCASSSALPGVPSIYLSICLSIPSFSLSFLFFCYLLQSPPFTPVNHFPGGGEKLLMFLPPGPGN